MTKQASMLGICLSLAVLASTAVAGSDLGPVDSALVVAGYSLVVPRPTAEQRCTRVCTRSRSMGKASAPVCVAWRTVC